MRSDSKPYKLIRHRQSARITWSKFESRADKRRYMGARQQFILNARLRGPHKGYLKFLWNQSSLLIVAVESSSLISPLFIDICRSFSPCRGLPDCGNFSVLCDSKGRVGRVPGISPPISTGPEQELPAIATVRAHLTQKHRGNAGPEHCLTNPVVIEAARDG
jgi:hypothetical protein